MPFRSYRVTINNSSDYLTLAYSTSDQCDGGWTDGWDPHGSIPPGGSGGFQIESDGFLLPRGCEGWVKYDVTAPEGDQGQLYVYVDNPAFGITRPPKVVASTGDVQPDCDGSSGSSSFAGTTATSFSWNAINWVRAHDGTEITSLADLAWWYTISGLPTAVLPFFGSAGIISDPQFVFDVIGGAPTFADLGATEMRPRANATLDDWAKEWRSENTVISITRLGTRRVRVNVAETHGDPPFTDSGTSSLGIEALAARLDNQGLHRALGLAIDPTTDDPFLRHAVEDVVSTTMGPQRSAIATKVQLIAHEVSHQQGLRLTDPPRISEIAALAAEVVFASSWTLRLGPVVLSLYGLYQSGSLLSMRLAYQRLGDAGDLVADDLLAPYIDIR